MDGCMDELGMGKDVRLPRYLGLLEGFRLRLRQVRRRLSLQIFGGGRGDLHSEVPTVYLN